MRPGSVDWPLVLDFVKAVAAPLAAVVAVFLASRLAVRGFRSQKLLERRLDWYEKMVAQLWATSSAYWEAALPGEELERDKLGAKAFRSGKALLVLAHQSALYADTSGHEAVALFVTEWGRVGLADPTIEGHNDIQTACKRLADALATEMRKDLRLKPVKMALTRKTGPGT